MRNHIGILACLLILGCFVGCASKEEQLKLAMQAIENQDYETALATLETAEQAGEDARFIARARGVAYIGLTRYEEAAQELENALALGNGHLHDIDFDMNYYLAVAYTKQGLFQKAEQVYDAILALRPDEVDATFLRGNVRLEQGRFEQAQEDFARSLRLDENNTTRRIAIFEALLEHGYQEESSLLLEEALASGKDKMKAGELGRIYFYLEDYEQAAAYLEDARSTKDTLIYLYLGKSYEEMGEYNYAASVYNSYLVEVGNNARIQNQLGLCELARENYDAALEAFRSGVALADAENMQALSFIEIVACEYTGDFEQARTLLQSYITKYPDDQNAKRELDFLQTR
ncbi:MAG: tetratricopeptide repeat protein [Clostridium sp.]|jgi:tetratricopeptide (TPR) repeat protein|nr:tetratricopeptide repeat protein [Clostridium sp.]